MPLQKPNPLENIIYSKNNCNACNFTKRTFKSKNIPYVEINIEESGEFEEYIDFLKDAFGGGSLSMPVVFPAKETHLDQWSGLQMSHINQLAEFYKILE